MSRLQWCRNHIDDVAKACDLSKSTVLEVKQASSFCDTNSEFSELPTSAILTLIRVKDTQIRDRAIIKSTERLNAKIGAGRGNTKQLTEKDIKKIIDIATTEIRMERPAEAPPENSEEKKEPAPEIKPPKKKNNAGNYQPGELTPTNLPPQPSLAAQQKAKEPEVDANGFFVTTPAKSQAQIRKENLALLEESCDLMLSRMPSARYVTIIELAMSEFPGEFPTKSQVISAALDLFNARKK